MKEKNKQKYPLKLVILSWLPAAIAMVVMIAFLIPVLAWAIPRGSLMCIVDGTSMDTTLHDGQMMFQNGKDFARGDIVTCTIPASEGSEETKILVKRIVGMPGDAVYIDQSGVYINGEKLTEEYLTAGAVAGTYREALCNDIRLGATEYFLMGDNRGISYDSRYFGAIDRDAMLYKVSTGPAMPFFLMVGRVLLVAAAALVLNILLEKALIVLFCKWEPALIEVMAKEDKKAKEAEEAPKDEA